MWRELRDYRHLGKRLSLFSFFKCDVSELVGFVFISSFAIGIFVIPIHLLNYLGICKADMCFAYLAGCIVGCAFMLSSKDRKIEDWQASAERLQKEVDSYVDQQDKIRHLEYEINRFKDDAKKAAEEKYEKDRKEKFWASFERYANKVLCRTAALLPTEKATALINDQKCISLLTKKTFGPTFQLFNKEEKASNAADIIAKKLIDTEISNQYEALSEISNDIYEKEKEDQRRKGIIIYDD